MVSILYSFRRCPFAMRARMAIAVAGLDPEHREILLRERPAHLREISPKATVPVLQLDDATVLEESLDIMRWALAQNDPEGWLPTGADVAVTDALVARNDGEFKHDLDRFKYPDRYEHCDPLVARERGCGFLAELEMRLATHRHLLRDEISFVDVAVFPFVRQFARADETWFATTNYPAVRRWLAAGEVRSIFRSVMKKIPPWAPGDVALSFRSELA